jgi:ribonucleotide monophosphatase NagD (HAD superfamily)
MGSDSYDSIFMVGDQLDVDIAFAKSAWFTTIYFPSASLPRGLKAKAWQTKPTSR